MTVAVSSTSAAAPRPDRAQSCTAPARSSKEAQELAGIPAGGIRPVVGSPEEHGVAPRPPLGVAEAGVATGQQPFHRVGPAVSGCGDLGGKLLEAPLAEGGCDRPEIGEVAVDRRRGNAGFPGDGEG